MLNCKNNDRSHAHVPSFPQWERLAKLWTLTGIVQDIFITTGFLRMPFYVQGRSLLHPRQPLILHFYNVVISRMVHERNHSVKPLASFIQHKSLEIHAGSCVWQ